MHQISAVSASHAKGAAGAHVSRWRRARQRTYELLERAGSGDRGSLFVDIGLILLIICSVLAVILESVVDLHTQYRTQFYWFEVFTIAVFTCEYALRIWCSVEAQDLAISKGAPRYPRLRYLVSPAAIIDMLSILPFYLLAFGLFGGGDMRFLRAIRLLRIFKLTRYSAAFDMLIKAFSENAKSFVAAISILVIVMLLAATGMYFFEREAQPDEFSSIPAAMWWAFATLTTVGYGDVTPITVGGKIFGALMTVVGVGMVALPTGILASAYTEQLRLRSDEYRAVSKRAWEDGVIDEQEATELERVRESLGLGRNSASQILNSEMVLAALKKEHEHACPHCGRASE
ncbi:MAG: ion transporter [Woeseia sp.]